MKFYYVQRYKMEDGMLKEDDVKEIPEKYLEQTLKQNPLWRVVDVVNTEPTIGKMAIDIPDDIKVPKPDIKSKIECPICGKEFNSQGTLQTHKKTHENNIDRKTPEAI